MPPTGSNQPRTALVTGGARGIGRAVALALRDAGREVAACDLLAEEPDPDGLHTDERVFDRGIEVNRKGVLRTTRAGPARTAMLVSGGLTMA